MAFPHTELLSIINTATAERLAVQVSDLESVGQGPGRTARCNRALSIWFVDEKAGESIGHVRLYWADVWPDFSVTFTDSQRVKDLVLQAIPDLRRRFQH